MSEKDLGNVMIGVNLNNLKKELKGLIYKYLHNEIENFNIKDYIKKMVEKLVKRTINNTCERYVYSYLEESRIAVPKKYRDSGRSYEDKITLNSFIIQIIREVIHNRVIVELDKLEVSINGAKV